MLKNRYRSRSMFCCFRLHLYDLIQQANGISSCYTSFRGRLVAFFFGARERVVCAWKGVTERTKTFRRGAKRATFYRDRIIFYYKFIVGEKRRKRRKRAKRAAAQLIRQKPSKAARKRSENIYNFVGHFTPELGRAKPVKRSLSNRSQSAHESLSDLL